jgi:leucyl/phenylalanyl-tRNA--protein transferase
MFSRVSNASKAAFITMVKILQERGFGLIDCQVRSDHLLSLGAREIPRGIFLILLQDLLSHETYRGDWWKNLQEIKENS